MTVTVIVTSTMSILKHYHIIRLIFFLTGIAPFYLDTAEQTHKFHFLTIPVLVSILSSICIVLLPFLSFYLDSFGLITKLITYGFYGSLLFTNGSANLQCWYYKSIYQDVINRITRLENECNYKFSSKIFYKSIKHSYKVKVILVVGSYTISGGIVLAQAWYIGSRSTHAVILASLTVFKELICALAVLHFTLYVDIVRLFVSELNKQIRNAPICFFLSSKIVFLKDVKLMHMELFLLMKQINIFFGWNLVLLMIHYFILITFSFYWLYFTLQSNGESFSIAGELKVILLYGNVS